MSLHSHLSLLPLFGHAFSEMRIAAAPEPGNLPQRRSIRPYSNSSEEVFINRHTLIQALEEFDNGRTLIQVIEEFNNRPNLIQAMEEFKNRPSLIQAMEGFNNGPTLIQAWRNSTTALPNSGNGGIQQPPNSNSGDKGIQQPP